MKFMVGTSALALVASAMFGGAAQAADQELVIFNWLGGSEREMIVKLEEGFEAKYPEIDVKDINPAAGGDDARGGIRTALLAGEKFDILINTWPSLEKEMVDNGLLRPLDGAWEQYGWSSALSDSWKNLSNHDGKTYGAYFIAGNRSGLWHRTDTMKGAGIESVPTEWDGFLASFGSLSESGKLPVFIGARSWAQTEWFENALLKTAGTDFAGKLARHEAKWTDEPVKATFRNMRDMLQANCCADAETMLSTHWTDAADAVLKDGKAGYMLIGTWVNSRASNEYALTPGDDYDFVQFPTIDPAHADAMSVDGKNLVVMENAANPEAAEKFIDYVLSPEGSAIIAQYGQATPSAHSDLSGYDPVVAKYAALLQSSDVFFVLDDLLPAELSGEFRVSLQKFLKDPSDANIDAITQAIETKANEVYR
jgi:multiple sugar transport system substrate-binding protein